MAIYIAAYGAARRNRYGAMERPQLHLHPGGCPGAECDAPDTITVHYIGEAYAIMRALVSGLRYDDAQERYVRNRVALFRIWGEVRPETFTRSDVDKLPRSCTCPDHEDYAQWRNGGNDAMISAELARALGMPGVYKWDVGPRIASPMPERVNATTTADLSARTTHTHTPGTTSRARNTANVSRRR